MGRERMYAKRKESDVRKSAAKAMLDKRYQEVPEKNPTFTGEMICKKCGFKARYQFIRCPHCDEVQK